jgi:hypothetical protein
MERTKHKQAMVFNFEKDITAKNHVHFRKMLNLGETI